MNESKTQGYSQEDKEFLKIIEEGIKFVEGHYIMPLPFRDKDKIMPNNMETSHLKDLLDKEQTSKRTRKCTRTTPNS